MTNQDFSHLLKVGQNKILLYIMLGRLVILGIVLTLLVTIPEFKIDLANVSVFMAITFLLSLAYALWMRFGWSTGDFALYQFTIDVFILTGMIHFTGGIESSFSLIYPLIILAAGTVVSGIMAIKVTILAIILHVSLIILEANKILPYRGISPDPYQNLAQVTQITLMQVLILIFFAAVSNYLASRFFLQAKQLERLRSIAETTISSANIPLLAVDRVKDTIKMANLSACQTLDKTKEELENSPFSQLFSKASLTMDDITNEQTVYWMTKGSGENIPVSLEFSRNNLSGNVLSMVQEEAGENEVNLVAFRDLSTILSKGEELATNDRTNTAANMINEMVHVVRNPLTAIRGAGELINSAVEEALSRRQQINEDDFQNLKSMCEIIYNESQELDQKIKDFVEHTSNDKEKLKKLIEQADLWNPNIFNKS